MINLAVPPAFLAIQRGYQSLIPVYEAVDTGIDVAQEALQAVEDNVIEPAVSTILGVPKSIAETIGDFEVSIGNYSVDAFDVIGGSEESWTETFEGMLQFDRRENEVAIRQGNNISEQVTVFGSSDPAMKKRTMWNMLWEDGDLFSGETQLEDDDPDSILAPFSLYFPTSMWPYSTNDGSRYTVHDLGNEPIESDFLGTKPLVEIAMGRKLDKVGALPAFSKWGDIALGTPPALVWTGILLLAGFTVQVWGPPIGNAIGGTASAFATGMAEIGYATAKGIRKAIPIGKAE